LSGYGDTVDHRLPEVTPSQPREELQILLPERLVEPHPLPEGLHCLLRGIVPQDRLGRVARGNTNKQEDEG
jgi:hypothetical protein